LSQRDAQRELEELDQVFAGLAHASRRQILLALHFHGDEMTAGEIASRFECSWPTTSRHLRQLAAAGLVRVERRGRERIYRVDREKLDRVAGTWLGYFARGGSS
jgi:DNA-binding transcriptional ArsR family regulator